MRRFVLPLSSVLLLACPASDDTGADASTAASDDAGTVGGSGGSGGTDTSADETGAGTSGEELFMTVCSPCHGADGEGTTLGYELQHPVRGYSAWVVRNGRPGTEFEGTSSMAPYDQTLVSDAALEQIWDYLDALPQPTTGEGLYLDYCRNCHGVDAQGGPTGVNISEKVYAELLEKIREGEDAPYESRALYMPPFDSTWLSDAEIQLIADHIASL